jgi:hypothetical protein
MIRWTKISLAMLLLSGVYTAVQYNAHQNEDHGHELYGGEEPKYSYLKLRNKPYPWHYSNCDLLDFRCKQLARAAEEALKKQ